MAKSSVKVTQGIGQPEVAAEVIASSIVAISKAMEDLQRTRLTRRAIVALIHDHSKIPKGTIEVVLNNLAELERTWLRKV